MWSMYSIKIPLFFLFFLSVGTNAALGAEASFSWRPSQEPEVLGYKIYYGLSSGTYIDSIVVTPPRATLMNGRIYTTVTGLESNQTYHFAITAFSKDAESDYSKEITKHTGQQSLIPQYDWRLHYVDSEELIGEDGAAVNAFDGDRSTIWHTEWKYSDPAPPHDLQIDLGAQYLLDGFRYLPRQDRWVNGTVKKYAFYVSNDGKKWGSPVAQGSLSNDRTEKEIHFTKTIGRYVRFVAISEINNKVHTSIAEINLLGEIYSQKSAPKRILSTDWSLQYVDSEELIGEDGAATNAFDGDPNTIWHTEWKYSDPLPPHELQINLGRMYEIYEVHYLPRRDGTNGTITQYEIYVSRDGVNWGKAVASGRLKLNNAEKHISFTPKFGQYIALVALKSASNKPWTSVAEINVTAR